MIDLRERAETIVERYPPGRGRSAMLPLLHLAQERDGYVTPRAIEEIADILGLSTADVTGVASFYHMLHMKPKGRTVVSVCHTLACAIAGAEGVISALEDRLKVSPGQSTADGEFHLERAECLAHCEIAPMIQIDYDEMVGPLTPEGAIEVIDAISSGRFKTEPGTLPSEAELDEPLEAPLPGERERRLAEPISDAEGRFSEEVSQATEEVIVDPVGPVTQPPSYEADEVAISQAQPVDTGPIPDALPYFEEPLWVETIQLSSDEEELLKSPEERRGHRKPPAPDRLYEMPDEGPGPGPTPPDDEETAEETEDGEPPVRPRGAED
ncbi:MAG: NAD(P)H-dependent oxidoreductase subunit E [Actinobacteria bacterium]|nr:NAD(P)H-dependent oxidoreductase subunit E [Actinomycetota bacterium]